MKIQYVPDRVSKSVPLAVQSDALLIFALRGPLRYTSFPGEILKPNSLVRDLIFCLYISLGPYMVCANRKAQIRLRERAGRSELLLVAYALCTTSACPSSQKHGALTRRRDNICQQVNDRYCNFVANPK